MKERAAKWILVTTVPLLALALVGRADRPPPAGNDGLLGSQEIMNRIIGHDSYPITEGYDSNVLIQATTFDRMRERNTKALQTCTGILISEADVLTAAHCILIGVEDMLTDQRTNVIVGAHKLDYRGKDDIAVEVVDVPDDVPSKTIRRHVKFFWVPEPITAMYIGYIGDQFDNAIHTHNQHRHDYRVLRLQRSISPSEAVPTPLAAETMTDVPIGTRGVILGWGRQTADNTWPVTQLRGLNITTTECQFSETSWQEEKWPHEVLPENKARSIFICALRPIGKGGICPGDCGGPLIIDGSLRGISVAQIRKDSGADCTDGQLSMDVWLDIAAPPIADDLLKRLDKEPLEG